MGAPPSNPVTSGPGPERAVHYHIVGDFISSHVSPEAAQTIRISFRDIDFSDVFWAHESSRAFKSDLAWSYTDIDREDFLWEEFGEKLENTSKAINAGRLFVPVPNPVQVFLASLEVSGGLRGYKSPVEIPIPGSERYEGGTFSPSISNGIWTTGWGLFDFVEGADPSGIIKQARLAVRGITSLYQGTRLGVRNVKRVVRQVQRTAKLGKKQKAIAMTQLSSHMITMRQAAAGAE